jgi:hypothetical protein
LLLLGCLLTCCSVVEQPFKIPFVAAVAFYGNQIKADITVEAMRRIGERLQEALTTGKWKEFKLLLRFFACLQPVFEEDGIFAFLGQLFDTVVDLQSANENDVRNPRFDASLPLTAAGRRHRARQDHTPDHSLCFGLRRKPLPRESTRAA